MTSFSVFIFLFLNLYGNTTWPSKLITSAPEIRKNKQTHYSSVFVCCHPVWSTSISNHGLHRKKKKKEKERSVLFWEIWSPEFLSYFFFWFIVCPVWIVLLVVIKNSLQLWPCDSMLSIYLWTKKSRRSQLESWLGHMHRLWV